MSLTTETPSWKQRSRLKPYAARLSAWLPKGASLPPETWRQRHRALLVIIWLHVGAIPLFAVTQGRHLGHGLVEIVPVVAFGLLASWPAHSRKLRAAAAALALLMSSAILVHLSGGNIEMHFHFFVVIGLLSMYQDWFPFLLAIGFVAVHHGVFGLFRPQDVYDHPAALEDPLKWALIHAAFVLAASAAYVVSWRMNEHYRAAVAESNRELQDQRRKLLDRTIEATEQERKKLSAELHDGPVQHLTALDIQLETVMSNLQRSGGAGAERVVGQVQERLRSEIAGLRRMMSELRPPVLDERGLQAALADHVGTVERQSGLECIVESTLGERVDPEVETVLYRVAQEALTNVVKHARSDRAWLSLSTENGSVVLEVRDAGVGFDAAGLSEPSSSLHYGMIGMRERVEMAGGTWEVQSKPGSGTRVRAALPRGAS